MTKFSSNKVLLLTALAVVLVALFAYAEAKKEKQDESAKMDDPTTTTTTEGPSTDGDKKKARRKKPSATSITTSTTKKPSEVMASTTKGPGSSTTSTTKEPKSKEVHPTKHADGGSSSTETPKDSIAKFDEDNLTRLIKKQASEAKILDDMYENLREWAGWLVSNDYRSLNRNRVIRTAVYLEELMRLARVKMLYKATERPPVSVLPRRVPEATGRIFAQHQGGVQREEFVDIGR